MGPSSTHASSRTDITHISDDEKDVIADEKESSPPLAEPRPPLTTAVDPAPHEDEVTYPEGGRESWLVVLGAFSGLTASLGIYNTSGVFSAVIASKILPDEAPSTLGWLFSVYAFVVWACGVQVGPTFDAMGPRALIIAGTICTLVGMLSLSFCTEYYQIFLSFSILTGIGSSLIITPSMACVAHWFKNRRGLASGIAFIGGGFGGVLFPLMIQSLLPKVGWGWSVRILALMLLVFCAISITFCKSRVPPRKGSATGWRDTLPDPRIFVDGTGAMAATTAGMLFTDLAYFIPITYVPSYYLARQQQQQQQQQSDQDALTGSTAFAFQLLAILNAGSCIGRAVAGELADRFGRYNTMIVSLSLCTVSVLCFWLPDILVPNLPNDTLLIVFALLFGFVSGSNVSLTPICLGQLCETQEYGRYYASCFTVVAFGVLLSIPVAGGLLDAVEATGKEKYWGAALFTGLSYVAALLCFVWVRIRVKGMYWRTKW
ncbi:hypothetical protein LTR08_002514 [Meristemomyces frigidus]|nr:hypothetical protein LTR08_002514 [Meristemomyces frigidus]